MAEIRKILASYAEGDPFPPGAPNSMALLSSAFQAAATREHDDEGEHDTPRVAYAGGLIRYSGGSYSVPVGAGIDSVTIVGTGLVEVKLSTPMRSDAKWGAVVWPAETFGRCIEQGGTRTSAKTRVLMDDGDKLGPRSFYFFAVGLR